MEKSSRTLQRVRVHERRFVLEVADDEQMLHSWTHGSSTRLELCSLPPPKIPLSTMPSDKTRTSFFFICLVWIRPDMRTDLTQRNTSTISKSSIKESRR